VAVACPDPRAPTEVAGRRRPPDAPPTAVRLRSKRHGAGEHQPRRERKGFVQAAAASESCRRSHPRRVPSGGGVLVWVRQAAAYSSESYMRRLPLGGPIGGGVLVAGRGGGGFVQRERGEKRGRRWWVSASDGWAPPVSRTNPSFCMLLGFKSKHLIESGFFANKFSLKTSQLSDTSANTEIYREE
jgi:hypothetical protein